MCSTYRKAITWQTTEQILSTLCFGIEINRYEIGDILHRAILIHLFSLSQANHKKICISSIFLSLQSYVDPPLTQTVTVWSYPKQRDKLPL